MPEDRGLANAIAIFAIVLIVGAMMVLVLDPVLSQLSLTSECDVAACTTGAGWLDDVWTYFPLIVVLFAFLGFVRAASNESRRVR